MLTDEQYISKVPFAINFSTVYSANTMEDTAWNVLLGTERVVLEVGWYTNEVTMELSLLVVMQY